MNQRNCLVQNAATALLSGRLCILPGAENGRAQGFFFPLIIACIQVDLEFYKPSSPIVLGAVCLKNKFLFAHFGQHCNQGSHICWILFNLIDRNLAVKCSPYEDFSCRKASAFAIKWTGDCSLLEEAASSSRWLRRTGFKSELALHLELSTSLKKKTKNTQHAGFQRVFL